MATAKKAPAKKTITKKTTAKKPTVKKAAPAKKAAAPSIEKRLEVLEQKVEALENHDIVSQGSNVFTKVSDEVKDRYTTNPTSTIMMGVLIVLALLIILG